MPQLVFIPGPGAGATGDCFHHQLRHFPGSVALTLPGHPYGAHPRDTVRLTEWVRGWLWARGLRRDLVLCGFTLGAVIALQYGLDYPDEVRGLVLMTVALKRDERPARGYEYRLRAAAGDPTAYREWWDFQEHAMTFVEPVLRDRLMERHRQVGPLSQYHDLATLDAFDARPRIHTLRPKLLLVRGVDDPGRPPEYEKALHEAVPGSRYVRLAQAGHFPMAERPEVVNPLIEDFIATL